MFALSHSECLFPVWFGAVSPNPSSPTKLEAGLESWSSWDSCLGLPCSPFPTGAWAPVLRPLPAVLWVLQGPLTCAPLSLSSETPTLLEQPDSTAASFPGSVRRALPTE